MKGFRIWFPDEGVKVLRDVILAGKLKLEAKQVSKISLAVFPGEKETNE